MPLPPLIVSATLAVANVTVDQLVRDAWVCQHLGATELRLDAPPDDRSPDSRSEVHAEIIARVRQRCPEVVISAGSGIVPTPGGAAMPDIASARPDSMPPTPVKPELEVFDTETADAVGRLLDAGLVRKPLSATLILGGHRAPATARDVVRLVESLPEGTVWAAAGIGASMLPMNAIAVFAGGHVRTDPRLVERVAGLAGVAGRPLATPAQARGMLGLETRPGLGFRIRPARLPGDRDSMLRVLETVNMHRVPSPEMHDFDVGRWYVAEEGSGVIGVAGFRLLHEPDGIAGKTTLLAVYPEHREKGVGRALQELRLELMRDAGANRVVTNADRPETIEWYTRHFGYRVVGRVAKEHEFGLPEVDHWTTLEAPLS